MRFLALLPALFLVGCVAAPPGGVPGAALGAKVTVAATPGETGPEAAIHEEAGSEEAGPKGAGLKKANGAAEAKAAPATTTATTARNPGSASANAGENAGENPSKNTGANAGTNTGAQDALGAAAQRRLAARPPTPAPTPAPEPEALMGLDRAQISRLLGKPGLVRRDASAEVWQYVGAGCVLDLFLYGDDGDGGSGGRYRVTHYEMRGRDAGEIQPRRCLDGLVAARGPGKTG